MLFFHLLAALNAEWRCWGIKQLGNSHKSAIHKFRWASEEVDILCILGAVVLHQMGLHSPLHVSFNFLLKKLHGLPEVCASWDFRQMFGTSAPSRLQNMFFAPMNCRADSADWFAYHSRFFPPASKVTEPNVPNQGQVTKLLIIEFTWVYSFGSLASPFEMYFKLFEVVWWKGSSYARAQDAAEGVWRLGMQANQETPPVRPCKTPAVKYLVISLWASGAACFQRENRSEERWSAYIKSAGDCILRPQRHAKAARHYRVTCIGSLSLSLPKCQCFDFVHIPSVPNISICTICSMQYLKFGEMHPIIIIPGGW